MMAGKDSFFKYLSSDTALTVLHDLTLKFTNTLDFNDPFDYNPALSKLGLSKFINRVGKDNNVKIPRKKAEKNLKLLSTDEFRRAASSEFSVTCFSKSPHIVPMWAHYADCHRGCVLGFSHASTEELEDTLKSREWLYSHDTDYLVPYDVKYTNIRPTIFDSEGLTNRNGNGFDACLIKAKDWEYEQEVRVIKTKPAGIYSFNKSQLSSVRFGLNISQSARKKIIELVSHLKSEHKLSIKLFDVKLDHSAFLLNDVRC
ncbi:DUF2971 domain-containing protein [Kosakonia radicincitans]|uniref:DUF2971 domain-containing protein n=1 Tax=Kosakonia radicincitans TaxID=283686 RepID=UPI0011EE5FA3|nr:DUF2971 domain-containing protein [Kosakonia radicincitans]QEM90824.1 DUF2971 domain-containing protein [Kosakonia radicincitans]